jgi:hypothetical protein
LAKGIEINRQEAVEDVGVMKGRLEGSKVERKPDRDRTSAALIMERCFFEA